MSVTLWRSGTDWRREVGSRLREERNKRELRLEDVADGFGMDVSTWSRYERGLVEIDPLLLVRIAMAWNAPRVLMAHPACAALREMQETYAEMSAATEPALREAA